jgi:hypothetical protein
VSARLPFTVPSRIVTAPRLEAVRLPMIVPPA